jgi:hypothetical protein
MPNRHDIFCVERTSQRVALHPFGLSTVAETAPLRPLRPLKWVRLDTLFDNPNAGFGARRENERGNNHDKWSGRLRQNVWGMDVLQPTKRKKTAEDRLAVFSSFKLSASPAIAGTRTCVAAFS